MTATIIPAEIVLTSVDGQVFAFVNGVQVTQVANKGGFVTKIEKALKAAKVYRETAYNNEGTGALIAEGRMVVAA